MVDELADQPGGGMGGRVHAIGGADVAAEVDAERAIRQGVERAARLWVGSAGGGRRPSRAAAP